MLFLRVSLLPFAIGISSALVAGAAAQERAIESVLIQGEQQLPLIIRESLVGVLLAERFAGRRDKNINALLERGLNPIDGGHGRMVLLEAPGEDSPSELLARAIGLREENKDLIFQAGYVAEFENTNDPMLVTDQLVVQFRKGVDDALAEEIAAEARITLLFENPYMEGEYLARVPLDAELDTLVVSNALNSHPRVDYAHPNLIRRKFRRHAFTPNDRLFDLQWHHLNTGQGAGTVDADVDSDRAWHISRGDIGTVIAVIDGGFDMTHPDLEPNFWKNPGELPDNDKDNDHNGRVDDFHGWDFTRCDDSAFPAPDCGDSNPSPIVDDDDGRHGTPVAGAAAARGDNNLGVSGACPNCSIMLIRSSLSAGAFSDGLAISYAREEGTDIITNSWGYAFPTSNVVNAINEAANTGRGGLGSVILFAMNTTGHGWKDDCTGPNPDISSLENVIAVGAVSNTDQRAPSGYGDCIDLVGPSDSRGAAGGTLWPVTTDMQASAGYNNNDILASCASPEPSPPPSDEQDYTVCFSGTSFATPVIAGIAGLILTEQPTLTRLQVQRILQDTADKVEDSFAAYDDNTGFSSPTTAPQTGLTVGSIDGRGRANAFEAVRLAAPSSADGRNGTDVVVRDNRLDWGNTEQPSNVLMESPRGFVAHYQSADIKVDAPPFSPHASTSSSEFDKFVDEPPEAGVVNRVYLRVRNRGPAPATGVTTKLHWAYAGAGLPALPSDFWKNYPGDAADTSVWHPLGVQTLGTIAYSGSSVAGSTEDVAKVATFNFHAPDIDSSSPDPDHYCLFAVVESNEDPVLASSKKSLVPDLITPQDNNVTQRNVHLQDSGSDQQFDLRFLVNNPFEKAVQTLIRVDSPKGWAIDSDGLPLDEVVSLEAGQEQFMELVVQLPEVGAQGVVEARQVVLDGQKERVLGGVAFKFAPGEQPAVDSGIDIFALIRNQQRQLDLLLGLVDAEVGRSGTKTGLETIREFNSAMQSQNQLLLRDDAR